METRRCSSSVGTTSSFSSLHTLTHVSSKFGLSSHFNPQLLRRSVSGSRRGAIIGGVVGGIYALLMIGLLGFWYFRRRKKRKLADEAVPPITYSGLNEYFAGVPFRHPNNSQQSLVPPPLFASTHTSSQGTILVAHRRSESDPFRHFNGVHGFLGRPLTPPISPVGSSPHRTFQRNIYTVPEVQTNSTLHSHNMHTIYELNKPLPPAPAPSITNPSSPELSKSWIPVWLQEMLDFVSLSKYQNLPARKLQKRRPEIREPEPLPPLLPPIPIYPLIHKDSLDRIIQGITAPNSIHPALRGESSMFRHLPRRHVGNVSTGIGRVRRQSPVKSHHADLSNVSLKVLERLGRGERSSGNFNG